MNFYLNDSKIEFELENRDLKFYLNDRKIDFVLPYRQPQRVEFLEYDDESLVEYEDGSFVEYGS